MNTYRYTVTRCSKLIGTHNASGVSRYDAYVGLCLKHPDAQKIQSPDGRLILRFPETQEEWTL